MCRTVRGSKGVRVVGINVGDAPEAVPSKLLKEAGVTFPNLLDPEGAFFAKVATDKRLPRIYLLDAAGQDPLVRRRVFADPPAATSAQEYPRRHRVKL